MAMVVVVLVVLMLNVHCSAPFCHLRRCLCASAPLNLLFDALGGVLVARW